ncbi:MAG: hypothetical protein P8L18_16980 [Verrucomicrobiota bacterium]|nr:hypothetical protein [Verrucomicrobiota bacterium]
MFQHINHYLPLLGLTRLVARRGMWFLAGLLVWQSLLAASTAPSRIRQFDFEESNRQVFRPSSVQADGNLNAPAEPAILPILVKKGLLGNALQSMESTDGMLTEWSARSGVSFPLHEGSVRFWFKPEWSSGEGPGHYATLLSFGAWNGPSQMTGYWGLTLDPKGQRLQFGAQSREEGTTFLAASARFKKGQWYEIILSYAPESTWLYIDGKPHGPGKGVSVLPSPQVLAETGLALGNTPTGGQPVKGTLDSFEFFDFPLSETENSFKPFALSASVERDPLRVVLSWPMRQGLRYSVKRRLLGQSKWKVLKQNVDTDGFEDGSSGLQEGNVYAYEVAPSGPGANARTVHVATYTSAVHHRGKVLLLVDQTLTRALSADLEVFQKALERDGWSVVLEKAPRHDDSRWSGNVKRIQSIKEQIHRHLSKHVEGLRMALIIGHVAVPYAGYQALDGHVRPGDDHRGAWPSDAFYGDLDGVWRDRTVNHVSDTHRSNTNVPGDGKFDEDQIPTFLEVAVGRIDFAHLPSIDGSIFDEKPRRRHLVEIELIRQYLRKSMAYREGSLNFSSDALVQSFLPLAMNKPFYRTAIGNASTWFGHVPGPIRKGHGFHPEEKALWAFMAGRSGSASFADARWRTRDFNHRSKVPHAAFLMFYSSWHGDWNLKDAFLRGCLASPTGGLATMSMMSGPWFLVDMGRGACLGDAFLSSANQDTRRCSRALAILGDPTLSNYVTPPIRSLSLQENRESRHLTWSVPNDIEDIEGIYIYAFDSELKRFEFIERLVSESALWNIPRLPSAGTRWMVLIGQWIHSGSGSFVNLSHGVEYEEP